MAQIKGTTTSGSSGGSSSKSSSTYNAASASFASHVAASNPTTGVNAGYGSAAANAAGAIWGPSGDVASAPKARTTGVSSSSASGNLKGTVAGAGSSNPKIGTAGSDGSIPAGKNPAAAGGYDPTGAYKYYDPNAGYYGGGGSGGSSGGGKPSTEELLNQELYNNPTGDGTGGDGSGDGSGTGNGNPYSYLANGAPSAYKLPELDGPNPERVNHVDTEDLRNMLQQIVDLQKEQSEKTIDYNVERGTNELNRAMEDAAVQFQTQRDQVSADEANALDNQALYAEARGDRGGIGEAQYASIQNTAAQNRRAVNDAQVKLGTDTARQISDLRSQGEFEKADQLLAITQSHLAQLKDLEQWALGTNLSVDEFNSQLQQWVDEYNLKKQQFLSDLELSAAQLTGMFSDGTRTMASQQALIESLANSGNALLQAGVMPSRQQLEAMGLTETQAKAYFNKMGFAY